jgi:thiamine-phosphate pyrophosphorylase
MEGMHLPALYPITDARSPIPLSAQIRRLGDAGFPLVQFRGKPLDTEAQWRELRTALAEAAERGGWPAICVNDRADLAQRAAREGLAPWGLHLGQGDLPHAEARALPGLAELHLGGSTHCAGDWEHLDPACDHAGVGPFRATATKPDHAEPLGLEGLRAGCVALRARGVAPVAIGGLTLDDAPACFQAGAEAMAMVGGVARAADPAELLWQAQFERWRVWPPLARGRGVVLVGGSGAGKSSLAACLAQLLGLPFRGSDSRVEAWGTTIAAIFATRGEAGFRVLEAQAVLECLASPCVLALGAGAWQNPATREAARASGFCPIWLAEVPLRAWARVGRDPARPLAATREQFLARWAQRTAAWREVPMVLPLGRSPMELAEALVQSLKP